MFKKFLPQSTISHEINLVWLFRLRNMTIVAESLLVLICIYGLKIDLLKEQLGLVIIATCSINLYTWMRLKTNESVTEIELFFQIVLDVLALTTLLYLTGGASNPIIWVFLLPLVLTAIMLPQSYAWNMVILTCGMYTILIAYNIPLPPVGQHIPDLDLVNLGTQHYPRDMRDAQYFNLHIFGMWLGFVVSAGLVAFFVVELSRTLKERERSLAETRENALRDERVIALGTLAASAAHDMGTPLGTMAILAHEIELEYRPPKFHDLNKKITIINQQLVRCKEALSLLSASAGEMRAESGQPMLLAEYFKELLKLWRAHNTSSRLNLCITPTNTNANARIIADRTLTHSIINILNNAAQASPAEQGINFNADWDDRFLRLKISDFGPGFPAEIIEFAGKQPVASNKQGLGVGLFLTYTTISRLGGKIKFFNLASGGACVDISLPLFITETKNDDSSGTI